MGTYFFAVVDLDAGPVQMNPSRHEELTLTGHINAGDPRVCGVLAHISRGVPRRVWWMSDYSPEYEELSDGWYSSPNSRKLLEFNIPEDAPVSALELPIVADMDTGEFFDAREWADSAYPLPVLAGQYLAGSAADDAEWSELVGRWCGHRLAAFTSSQEGAVQGFRRIAPGSDRARPQSAADLPGGYLSAPGARRAFPGRG
jgi:hypothetical protein